MLPTLFIAVLCVGPALILIGASVGHEQMSGLWRPALELDHYRNLFRSTFLKPLATSFGFALATSALAVGFAFPVTYLIARMRRRAQIAWLICLLTNLSLSEVLIVFSWQTLLSARVGLTRPLVWLGLLDRPISLSPSLGGAIACMVYLVLPYVILLLYPAVSRVDREISEASATMGATPARTFFTVITPMLRLPLVTAWLGVMVTAAGAYLTPLVLAKPQNWTVGIAIDRMIMENGAIPQGAAQSVVLILVTTGVLFLARRVLLRPEA